MLGTRAVVSDPSCPCCDGCPLWRQLIQCLQGPSDCVTNPPPPMVVWVCATVTCSDGSPLEPGTVVKIDNFCFVVTTTTFANPVGILLPDVTTLPCYPSCQDANCPQGELYWPAFPCAQVNDEERDIIWVCGVPPGCHVRACLVIDGSVPPVLYHQIPQDPPPLLARFIDLTPTSRSCCECLNAVPCVTNNLLDYDPTGLACAPVPQDQCCCQFEPGVPFSVPSMTYRITHAYTRQTVLRPDFPNDPTINGVIELEMIDDCTSTARGTITGLGQPPGNEVIGLSNLPPACYRRCPGTWPYVAGRLVDVAGFQFIVGLRGQTWGDDCESGFTNPLDELETLLFSTQATCRSFSQIAEYRYTERTIPGDTRVFITRFEFTAEVIGPNQCEDCGGSIGGGVPLNVDGTTNVAAAATPCGGCGQGQGRTPA
jgi:hypothetical protein